MNQTLTKIRATLIGGAVVGVVLTAAAMAGAATFTVNSRGDARDRNLDGICDAKGTAGVQCTLRGALQEANETVARDQIAFDIGRPGEAQTIAPARGLPAISASVAIDGYTQPGARENTRAVGDNARILIEVNGESTTAEPGLEIFESDATVIRGLAINRFEGAGIRLDAADDNTVAGNFIGTDATGTKDLGNGRGVELDAGSHNRFGGVAPASRNVIAGNGNVGVWISIRELGPGAIAVASENRVLGNYIGTRRNGSTPLGNDDHGVLIQGSNNDVGGESAAAANVIAHNGGDGVSLGYLFGVDNAILGNSIYANASGPGSDDRGIRLHGVVLNDAGDGDTGPNNGQNYPVLTDATSGLFGTSVTGALNSEPLRTYTVQFFANDASKREGERFLGEQKVSTDSGGTAAVSFGAATSVPVDDYVTATATDAEGDTSEFSAPRIAGPPESEGG